jgi:hypothetical protein
VRARGQRAGESVGLRALTPREELKKLAEEVKKGEFRMGRLGG